MNDKRAPTLADWFVATEVPRGRLDRNASEDLRPKVRRAHRFVFDDAAAARLGDLVREVPDLVMEQYRFARPPFDLTWVEYPQMPYWHAAYPDKPRLTRSEVVGHLIEGARINTVMTSRGRALAIPTTVVVQGDGDGRALYRVEAEGKVFDEVIWGAGADRVPSAERKAKRMAMFEDLLGHPETEDGRLAAALSGAYEITSVIAIMLLLGRSGLVRHREVERTRGWLRNRQVPFMAFTSVRIDLDPVPAFRAVSAAHAGAERRRHEVRGHWCQNLASRLAGCEHVWQAEPGEGERPKRFRCVRCEGKRWWRDEHERGSAAIGYVRHENYAVTA